MKLKTLPENFQHKIRSNAGMTLILFDKNLIGAAGLDDGVYFENSSPLGKDKLVERFMAFDVEGAPIMLLAWTGQHRTDIFQVSREDILRHYK